MVGTVILCLLIPFVRTTSGKHSNLATIGFAIGFILMMILDVSLG